MGPDIAWVDFEKIALQMTSSLVLSEVLATIPQGLVDELGAAFARIWLLGPGYLCHEYYMVSACWNKATCLHLKSRAGMYTNLSSEYRRVTLDVAPIGRMAIDKK